MARGAPKTLPRCTLQNPPLQSPLGPPHVLPPSNARMRPYNHPQYSQHVLLPQTRNTRPYWYSLNGNLPLFGRVEPCGASMRVCRVSESASTATWCDLHRDTTGAVGISVSRADNLWHDLLQTSTRRATSSTLSAWTGWLAASSPRLRGGGTRTTTRAKATPGCSPFRCVCTSDTGALECLTQQEAYTNKAKAQGFRPPCHLYGNMAVCRSRKVAMNRLQR